MGYLMMLAIVYILAIFLRMNLISTIVVAVCGAFFVFLHTREYHRSVEKKNRFYEVCEYMDSILYIFQREEKIEKTFENLYMVLGDSHMRKTIRKALDYMKMTFDESEVYRDAMKLVEEEYPCERVKSIHDFMYQVELLGGEIKRPTNILIEDKNCWEARIVSAMESRRKMFVQVVLSVIASIMICGLIMHLPIRNVDISGNVFVQIVSVIVLVIDEFIILRAQKYLSADWISIEEIKGQDVSEKSIERFRNLRKNQSNVIWNVIGCLIIGGGIVCHLFHLPLLSILFFVVAMICINQKRISFMLLDKKIKRAIRQVFPDWLLNLVLLMQTENVQVSIGRSVDNAVPIMRKELIILKDKLELEPEAVEPYHDFFGDFAIPEVHSAMGMLYSLSMGDSNQGDKQMEELLKRNLIMMDEAKKGELANSDARMYLLFLAPVLSAALKLLVDMLMVMMAFLSTLSVMGLS